MSRNALAPNAAETLNRLRADLRMGLPVVLCRGERAALVVAAEMLTAERLEAMRQIGGALELAITAHRAESLKARAYDGDLARVLAPANATLGWFHAVCDPSGDLSSPAQGPLHCLRDGASDLHRVGIALAKSAQLLPAVVMVTLPEGAAIAGSLGLSRADIALLAPELARALPFSPVATARLPMTASEAGRVHVFRPGDGSIEHYAIEIGTPPRDRPVLARLHSACFTGDVLGSLKCDCGPQLAAALDRMGAEGAGVLIYLNQEGRGIGLANKMRAYALQDQGFDTVEANHRLGFEDDERDFRIGASLLREMGFSGVRLLTNNPSKVRMLGDHGIEVVERVPLKVGQTAHNAAYLATKALKSGHML
ncbi:GTP cyclohydrolase II [Halovulum dunhuangense]|uniref:GTP cyclohydrolase-2 n=1 Tax=Halovulum dunhuangense TaxID=1505036 RepID=A0A849KW87_9RHOB|nr:GTP cyclohydrolase II [Halovulum dunhuangense]NNU79455.1 GTP cyclohydrolase II [Halovulum dunhuangense]